MLVQYLINDSSQAEIMLLLCRGGIRNILFELLILEAKIYDTLMIKAALVG